MLDLVDVTWGQSGGLHAQYSTCQKTSFDILNKGIRPRNYTTVLKLGVWLGSIHSKAPGNSTAQGSHNLWHDIAGR